MAYTYKMAPDYYNTLEVHPSASMEVIHAAYRALMKKHHPDKKQTVGNVARTINEAYEVLSDPAKKAAYDAARENLQGKVIGGEWRLLSSIAEGGFGKTYLAEHTLVGEKVCVKHCSRISAADAAILTQEAKAMWNLRHYALPAVRTLIKLDDGSLALVMSYVEGQTLDQIVQKMGALPPEHVCWITSRILNALSYIHRHGVVHGDIKPQNVVVDAPTHAAYLVDFGLAAVKPTKQTGSAGYTEIFAPPEQVQGAPLIPGSDFYALGMTMLYALTGGDEVLIRARRVPASVPDPVCKFLIRLLVRDPLARPDWDKEDIIASFEAVRQAAFGRVRSGMLPLL